MYYCTTLLCTCLLFYYDLSPLHLENPPLHVEPQSRPQSLHLDNRPVHVEPQIRMLSQGIPFRR